MILRRLHLLVLALMLFAAGGPACAGTTYTFNGGAVANCPLSGTTYSCPSLPLTAWDDAMVIASGYTVNITSSVNFGFNHGLAMSGSAVLSSTGDLNIGNINPVNLQVSGGTLIAGNTFSVGSQAQTLTANIRAGDANLGTGSGLTINGNVTATGTVDIATHATINGTISGATVNAHPGVALYGNIVATKSFTLGSQGTVKGDITAPVVSLLPAQSDVRGKITAKVSLELGSQVNVTGDVVAGTLTLNPANAIVDGNATVDSAVLGWQDRITQAIYCRGGTMTGRCDCVTNNSGYEVNTDAGPHCQGNSVALDHFVIGYDATASLCAASAVTITACANTACTSTYGGGATITLAPTGQSVTVPASGTVQASVSYTQAGTNTLGVSGATTAGATTCWRNGDAAPGANCQVSVSKSAYTLSLNGAAFYAEAQAPQTTPTLTLAALRFDDASKACVPLFNNTSRDVTFTCGYANTSTPGLVPVRLNGQVLNAGQNAATACDGNGRTLNLAFDANGKASLPMQYADAGQVTVTATDNGSGSPGSAGVTATFVPAAFQVALAANNSYVAGYPFTATVTAVNGLGATTRKFGTEGAPESATLSAIACQPNNGNGLLAQTSTMSAGVQTFALTWTEVGNIDLAASLKSGNYLGSGMVPAGATTNKATTGCTGAAGRFIPAYFTLDPDPGWKRTATVAGATLPQYYSGEPAINVTVTARNKDNGVTQNYAGTNARDVTFTAVDAAGAALVGNGSFSRSAAYPASDATGTAQVRGTDFVAGVGTWTGSYTFSNLLTAPTRVRVHATDADKASSSTASEPTLLVRSGRVRIPSRFGSAASMLKVPVSLEYYTGQTWVLNAEDSTTAIPASAISVGNALGTIATGLTPFANGAATLSLTPPAASGRGSIPFALNLGNTSANTSCYYDPARMTPSTGAKLAFLRSADPVCKATSGADPAAMATFGIFAPETKRVIHVREVYR